MTASANQASWDDPKYLKLDDCDERGYCLHCGTATVHYQGCVLLVDSKEQP